MARSGVTMTVDNMSAFLKATRLLESTSVMVGVPQSDDKREEGDVGNADIGYLMENGIPEHNVPARPHLVPGVARVQEKIGNYLDQAATLAYEGKSDAVLRALHAAGITAENSVKGLIRAGIAPPLSERTLRERAARGRSGAAQELKRRARGYMASTSLAKPLIDTGQYLAAITHVLRQK